jgi:hypothetical protein
MTQPPQPPGEPPRAEAARWQALFRRAAEPLFLLNRRRRILFANAAWEALTAIPLREARGLTCKRYRAAEPGSREAVLHALSPPPEALAGHVTQSRCLLLQAGGEARTWEVAFFPFRDADGLLGILGRITPEAAGSPAGPGPLPARLVGLRDRLFRWHRPENLGGDAPAVRRVREQIRLAGQTQAPVLLLGEAGAGKQWTARAIHQQGPAGARTFVGLDCQRLPAPVVEAAVFGGGGLAYRPGVGTLYLREPQYLPRELQARLAELAAVLPGEGEGRRPGPRVLAGCAADPQAEVRRGRLLDELHGAVAVLTIALPPLRERQADLTWLVRRLLARAVAEGGRPPDLTADAWEVLRAWSWPGNLRELYAVLQSACRRAGPDAIEVEDLPWYLRSAPPPPPRSLPLKAILQDVERRLIKIAMRATGRNKTKAARLLGVWRALLVRRLKDLGVEGDGD